MSGTVEEVRAAADRVLRDHLLGSKLYDTLTLDQFKALFPQKYRSSPLVDDIYDLLLQRRDEVRQVVEANIQGFVDNINLSRQVPNLTLADAIALLKSINEKHQLELAHERARLQELEKRLSQQLAWMDGPHAKALAQLSRAVDLDAAKDVHRTLVGLLESS
ncbi:hypothetical protein PTSG_11326 [Salpingoeca rosetta]|uniref:Uncharacterized protein n=1 Tax=Salpingoeca rosetta (strain ATCC 50818 / BSB-021) TaxID=946362 RepID=F2UT30_SALR5|nr:uncharacterized protein PTSG_11326 [Salpingoeca rosetta]EGD81289.1 hypothetical protein PTSG_11326 [Salpingoeca rosetta]|eukprot:XP_004987685.1 hypothetical protein PTSG_11326 [Salpingoeca rosetta]